MAGALLLGSACSSDSNADFDPAPSGGDSSSGGTKLSSSGSGTGAAQTGGSSNGTSGEATGGTGNSAGSDSNAGKASGGKSQGGSSTGGSSAGGSGGRTNGGAGMGGTTAGSGGKGGTAGTGGTTGGGGNAGTAGSGGSGGSGGANSDCAAANFAGHAYYFCGIVESASAAASKCQSLNMNLVTIESMAENTFVLGKQKGPSWLGGTDLLTEGEWRWAPATTVFWNGGPKGALPDGTVDGVYSNFIVGQPNNSNDDGFPENCLATSASGWNDLYCSLGGVRAACEGTGPVIQPTQ